MRAATASAPASWDHKQPASPEQMLRAAMTFIGEHGLVISPSKARRLVRGHLRGVAMTDDEKSLMYYLLTFADPTGETAARNVDREVQR